MHARKKLRLQTRSHLCVRQYCCSQVCGCLKTHTGRCTETLLWQKQSSQALERLKIVLDWQPNCRHYSFHHFYQPCGAHAVGGQSSCFHGAFHTLQPHSHHVTPLYPPCFLKKKSCPLLPLCDTSIPLLYGPPSHLFFPSLHLPASLEALMSDIQYSAKTKMKGRANPWGKPSSFRVVDWEGLNYRRQHQKRRMD